MEPRRTLTIHLDLHWRAIVAAACIVAVLVLALNVISAQGNGAGSANDLEARVASSNDQVFVAATPDEPLPDCGEKILTVNGECVGLEALGTSSSLEGARVTAAGRGVGHVYVTEDYFYPDQALAACGPGYHMASLWEILDTSNWVYDDDHPAAHVQDDSGHGPPSSYYGWIRTGYWASGDPAPGTGNCLAWASRDLSNYGTLVRLSRYWETAPGEILTWDAYSISCDSIAPVWCVTD
jgi:hypothetical protein